MQEIEKKKVKGKKIMTGRKKKRHFKHQSLCIIRSVRQAESFIDFFPITVT